MEISHTWACVCVRGVDVILKRGTHNAARFQPFATTGTRLYFSLRLRIYSATATATAADAPILGVSENFYPRPSRFGTNGARSSRAERVKSGRHVTGRQSQAARNANRDTIARYGRYSNSASPKCDKRYKRAREKSTRGNSENCEHRCTDFPRLRARFRIRFARTGRDRRTDFGVPIDLPWSAVPFYLFLSSMKSRAELRRPPTS